MEHQLPNTILVEQLPIAELVILFMTPQAGTMQRRIANRIHKLYINDLYRFCLNVVKKQFGHTNDWEEIAEEICFQAMQLLLQKLPTLKLKEACSDKEAGKVIGTWLNRTANNIILKHIEAQVKQNKQLKEYKEFVELDLENSETVFRNIDKSYDHQKFLTVWNKLSDMVKEVIMLSYQYDCFPTSTTKNKRHLPKDVLDAFCIKYNTHKDTVRQGRNRAFKDILACQIT